MRDMTNPVGWVENKNIFPILCSLSHVAQLFDIRLFLTQVIYGAITTHNFLKDPVYLWDVTE
jgi:hypothetical protein